MNTQILKDNIILNIIKDTLGDAYKDKVFLCGGAVRDFIRGKESEDIDILYLGDINDLIQTFKNKGVGEGFAFFNNRVGTNAIKIEGHRIEICSGHNGATTLTEDAIKRDFTINSLFYNLWTGEIIDPNNKGVADLQKGIIDTCEEPEITINDDPSRIMRAVRFSVIFDYKISKRLEEYIKQNAQKLLEVPSEKVETELTKIILSKRPVKGLRILQKLGILKVILPELSRCVGCEQNNYHYLDVFEHTLKVLGSLKENTEDYNKILRYAALFHDVGKPAVWSRDDKGVIHFYGHEEESEKIARQILNRLRFSNSNIKDICYLISSHMKFSDYTPDWSTLKVRKAIQDLNPKYVQMFCDLRRADILALAPKYRNRTQILDDLERRFKEQTDLYGKIPSVVDGNEIMEACHLKTGTPIIGEIISYLQDLVVCEKLRFDDKETAKKLAYEKYKTYIKSPLSGDEIIKILNIKPGKQVGEIISYLKDCVAEGTLSPEDKEKAENLIKTKYK
ncbi:MAG: HD domain-containing protein [Abditibacteriota bacterium]|nr:HD domain-containing protein [Abditibacteriota bacterium]